MPLETRTMEELRETLLAQRHALLREFSETVREHQDFEGRSFPDVGDEAYATEEKRLLEKIGESDRAKIEMVDEALSRMKSGEYGLCIDCEEPIPPDRLKAYPSALRCVSCQSALERGRGGRS